MGPCPPVAAGRGVGAVVVVAVLVVEGAVVVVEVVLVQVVVVEVVGGGVVVVETVGGAVVVVEAVGGLVVVVTAWLPVPCARSFATGVPTPHAAAPSASAASARAGAPARRFTGRPGPPALPVLPDAHRTGPLCRDPAGPRAVRTASSGRSPATRAR